MNLNQARSEARNAPKRANDKCALHQNVRGRGSDEGWPLQMGIVSYSMIIGLMAALISKNITKIKLNSKASEINVKFNIINMRKHL